MTEFFFYHLERQPLEKVLPLLLEKTLARGWRACLRFSTKERMEAIDSALWTYREESFLPHGTAQDGFSAYQPIFLTLDKSASPNSPAIMYLLEQAEEDEPSQFERVIRIFGDEDEVARTKARKEWQFAKKNGFEVSYWKQNSKGGWERTV